MKNKSDNGSDNGLKNRRANPLKAKTLEHWYILGFSESTASIDFAFKLSVFVKYSKIHVEHYFLSTDFVNAVFDDF